MKAHEYVEAVKKYKKLEEHFFGIFISELTEELSRRASLPQDGSALGQSYAQGQQREREAILMWASHRKSSNQVNGGPNG